MHRAPGRSRRDVLHLLGVGAVALPAALRPMGTGATRGWCQTDPIVEIAGQRVDISLASYEEMLKLATGPAKIIVTVPAGIRTRLVSTDAGFGHGYRLQFKRSRRLANTRQVLEVRIQVHAPARKGPKGHLPLRVLLTPLEAGRLVAGVAEGRANKWVVLHTP